MVTAELVDYVRGQISQGQNLESIKIILLNQKWNEVDINEAFSQVGINQAVPLQAGVPPTNLAPRIINNVDSSLKLSKKKRVAYFLIGLFTQILGLFVAGLWILIKVKENKKPRFLSLLAGLGTAIIIGVIFSLFISPKLKQTLVNKFPEMSYIPSELSKSYPEAQFGIDVYFNKSLSGQNAGTTTSTLTVSIKTSQVLTSSDRKQIGGKICRLLEDHNVNYTYIKVAQINVRKILFFPIEQSYSEERTCSEWKGSSSILPTSIPVQVIESVLHPTAIVSVIPNNPSVTSKFQSNGAQALENGVTAEVTSATRSTNVVKINITFKNTSALSQTANLIHVQMHDRNLGTGNKENYLNTTLAPGENRSFSMSFDVLPDPPFILQYGMSNGDSRTFGTYTP